MSEDELFVVAFCLGISLVIWLVWIVPPLRIRSFGRPSPGRLFLLAVPVLCAAVLYYILRAFAASDVRNSPAYLFFYMMVGAAWVGIAKVFIPFMGLNARDDVAERQNTSAAIAIVGALLGLTLCFAGGNIGDGPGWWVVLFCALLSTAAFYFLWIAFEMATTASDSITIDRDLSAGLRVGALLVALGLVLGRSVAGDWVSTVATWKDFIAYAYPTAILTFVAVGVEYVSRPTPETPKRHLVLCGMAPALLYVAAAVIYIRSRGSW